MSPILPDHHELLQSVPHKEHQRPSDYIPEQCTLLTLSSLWFLQCPALMTTDSMVLSNTTESHRTSP